MNLNYNCCGDTHLNLSFNNLKNEIEAIFDVQRCSFQIHLINGREYQENLVGLEADVLFNIIRKQWVVLEEAVLEDICTPNVNISETQELLLKTLKLCRYCLQEHSIQKQVNTLLLTVQNWSNVNEKILAKLSSPSVRDDRQPIAVYYHLYLEIQWLIMSVQFAYGSSTHYTKILDDLITVSYALYQKTENIKDNPFICTCTKRLWLLLQYFCERTQKEFWTVFNEAIRKYDEVFSLWLLYNVARLHGYNEEGVYVGFDSSRVEENFALIEITLKSINLKFNQPSKNNNSVLLKLCNVVNLLVNDWWVQTAKSEPFQILWEIFNKLLDISMDTGPTVDSARDLMEVTNHISSSTEDSFEYFLFILKEHLIKHPSQWPRIRGRIYSKISCNKIRELTNVGLYHVGVLFLSLAQVVNIGEITEKLFSLFDIGQSTKVNPLALRIHMCLIVLHVQQGHSIKHLTAPLLKIMQEDIIEHREKYNLIRIYIDGFDSVLNASKNYYLKQHTMLDSWVSKYIISCPFSDLCNFLNILLCNVKFLRKDCAWTEWEPILKEHVLPGLKTIATSANCPSQVGTLAALIDSSPTSDYVQIFTSDPITVSVSCHFITTLLEDVPEGYCNLPKHHETAILHAWTRCCLLNYDLIEDLSINVFKIGALNEVFSGNYRGGNPLCAFIKRLGTVNSKLVNSRELCEQCFGRLDTWISPHIVSPSSEASALHIYTCLSVLFFHCSPLLYHRNRSNCLLNRLVNLVLLSTDILMGKTPHAYILGGVQRTWHLFMHGINALDYTSDAYIDRTLRDMVTRYVPLLSTNNSPILKCFNNEMLATFIAERISISFLLNSSRSSEVNTMKALKIIQLALENTSNMQLILKCTLLGIFEVIFFQSNKSLAIDLIISIVSCERREEAMHHVKCAFITLTEKHLAFHTQNYFQFTTVLSKIMPSDMLQLLPIVKKQVVEVEQMRGVGYDNILRQGLNRLEMLLS